MSTFGGITYCTKELRDELAEDAESLFSDVFLHMARNRGLHPRKPEKVTLTWVEVHALEETLFREQYAQLYPDQEYVGLKEGDWHVRGVFEVEEIDPDSVMALHERYKADEQPAAEFKQQAGKLMDDNDGLMRKLAD